MNSTDDAALEAELLARIAEDPQSDGPRIVLADFYLQRDDPRGKLISHQLANEPVEAAVLTTLAMQMVGTLGDFLVEGSLSFERGRLSVCQTKNLGDGDVARVRGNPIWATVREVVTNHPDLLTDPMLRSLRKAGGLGIEAFGHLCRTERPLPIEELTVWFASTRAGTPQTRIDIANTPILPALRRINLVLFVFDEPIDATDLEWLLASPLGQQLDTLLLHGGLRALDIRQDSFDDFRRRYPRPLNFHFNG